jgi:hypothetical protein
MIVFMVTIIIDVDSVTEVQCNSAGYGTLLVMGQGDVSNNSCSYQCHYCLGKWDNPMRGCSSAGTKDGVNR